MAKRLGGAGDYEAHEIRRRERSKRLKCRKWRIRLGGVSGARGASDEIGGGA